MVKQRACFCDEKIDWLRQAIFRTIRAKVGLHFCAQGME